MDKRVLNPDPSIIHASSIVIDEESFPSRIVLRLAETKDEYIVHLETLKGVPVDPNNDPGGTRVAFKHEAFAYGKYFSFHPHSGNSQKEAKKMAEENFLERSRNLIG